MAGSEHLVNEFSGNLIRTIMLSPNSALGSSLKYSSAMLLTSNRAVEEWPQVFSDPILANAAIDRMFENANIILFEGPSYRMKGRIIMPKVDNEK